MKSESWVILIQSYTDILVNIWGGVLENNHFGTHEFFELCEQLGCKTYINGNLGSGTVQEMYEWVEYMTSDGDSPMTELRKKNGREKPWKVDYFGVGNESWGCGGNMTPQYYANEYRRYQTYVRQFNKEHRLQKICCGANASDYQWTRKVLETCTEGIQYSIMDGLSLHYYTVPRTAEGRGSGHGIFPPGVLSDAVRDIENGRTEFKGTAQSWSV